VLVDTHCPPEHGKALALGAAHEYVATPAPKPSLSQSAYHAEQVPPDAGQLTGEPATGFEHVPLLVSHVPATWHASDALQTTALLPTQTPFWHVSVCVQELPSLHAFPVLGWQDPPLHAKHPLHARPLLFQVPVASHDCGCWPLQRPVFGVHCPAQLPPEQR